MEFKEKLIDLRKKAGLSQEQLGEKLNVARQTVSKWELGDTTPEMDKLIKIGEIFNVSLDELTGKETKSKAKKSKAKKNILKIILIVCIILILIYFALVLKRFIMLKRLYNDISKIDIKNYEISSETKSNEINSYMHLIYVNGESILSTSEDTYEDDKLIEEKIAVTYANKNTNEAFRVYCDEDGNTIKEEKGIKYINYSEYPDEHGIEKMLKRLDDFINEPVLFDIFNTKIKYVGDSCYEITYKRSNRDDIYIAYDLGESGSLLVCRNDKVTGEKDSEEYEYMPIYENFEEAAIEKPDISGVEFETYDYNEEIIE